MKELKEVRKILDEVLKETKEIQNIGNKIKIMSLNTNIEASRLHTVERDTIGVIANNMAKLSDKANITVSNIIKHTKRLEDLQEQIEREVKNEQESEKEKQR